MWFEGIAWADAAGSAAAPAAGPQSFLDQMLGNPVVPLVLVVAIYPLVVVCLVRVISASVSGARHGGGQKLGSVGT